MSVRAGAGRAGGPGAEAANQAYSMGLAAVGEDVLVFPTTRIVPASSVVVGDSVIVDDFVFVHAGPTTRIGSFVHIASFTSVTGGGEFVMEDFSGLSGGVRVYTGNEDYTGGCLTNPTVPAPYRIAERSHVRVGRHAIVGANAVILPGVTIGEGAAVGAGSLVTRDVEPWTICAGSPARRIRRRPAERMLELEARLREELYDASGTYVPKARREGS